MAIPVPKGPVTDTGIQYILLGYMQYLEKIMHSMLESLKEISISVGRTLLTGPRSFRIIGDANRLHPNMESYRFTVLKQKLMLCREFDCEDRER
jgi:hypothetical protein